MREIWTVTFWQLGVMPINKMQFNFRWVWIWFVSLPWKLHNPYYHSLHAWLCYFCSFCFGIWCICINVNYLGHGVSNLLVQNWLDFIKKWMAFKEIAVFCELTWHQVPQIGGVLKVNFLCQKPYLLFKKQFSIHFF